MSEECSLRLHFFVVEVCLPGEQHLHCHQLLLRVEGGLMDAVVLRPQPVQSKLVGRRTQGCDVGPGQRTTDPPKTQRCKYNPFPEKTEDSRISGKMYHWVVLTVFAIRVWVLGLREVRLFLLFRPFFVDL